MTGTDKSADPPSDGATAEFAPPAGRPDTGRPDANLLGEESSPYLLQHRDNPVHWRAWGEAAFAEAKADNRPVLLSIGYAACHWCHVMAHESFEDEPTAGLMNELFVNIKVDREERPDRRQPFIMQCRDGDDWTSMVDGP